MKLEAKVGVVIPSYNGASFLEKTLFSLQNQTFHDWEAVIVVDGSTDRTVEFFNDSTFVTDKRFHLLIQKNKGVSAARNAWLALCNTKYVALLDHDDIWHSSKLMAQVNFLDSNPDYLACLCWYLTCKQSKEKYAFLRLFSYKDIEDMIKGWLSLTGDGPLAPSTLMFRRQQLNLNFTETLNAIGDLDFVLRLLVRGNLGLVKAPLVLYVQHMAQMHRNSAAMEDYLSLYANLTPTIEFKFSLDNKLLRSRVENHLLLVNMYKEFMESKELLAKIKIFFGKGFWNLQLMLVVLRMLKKRVKGYYSMVRYFFLIRSLWR